MPEKKRYRKKTTFGKAIARTVWVLFVFSIAGFAVYAGIYLEKNTIIQEVLFTGNHFTNEQSLFEAIDTPVGLNADSVDYRALFNEIRQLPYVSDVTVTMTIRGVLNFRISEHVPIAMLADANRRVYVSQGGIKLPVKHGKAVDVPLLHGFPVTSIADTLNTDAFRQIESFLTAAKQNDTGWITISEITWNDRKGIIALTHENGVNVIFGKDNFHEKILNWEAFYTQVVIRKGIQHFSNIDLRYKDQIVIKHS